MSNVEKLREMRDVQGQNGTWNYDPYMLGMYNGMEFSLSLMEGRDPEYRTTPTEWLCDKPREMVLGEPEVA